MLVPVNPNAGNHMILFDTVNRGTNEAPAEFNVGAAPANPAADGFFREPGIDRGMDRNSSLLVMRSVPELSTS